MKYVLTYKLFEDQNSYVPGDMVLIRYWVTGDIVPVKIERKIGKNYIVSFQTNLGTNYQNSPELEIKPYQILQIYKSNSTPASGDSFIKNTVSRISNDLVINNYPKSI